MACGLALLSECKTPQGSSMIQAEKSQRAVFGLRHEHSTSMFTKHVHSQCLSWLHMLPAFLFLIKLFLSCLLLLKKVIYLIYSFCMRKLFYLDKKNVKVIGNSHNTNRWVEIWISISKSDLTILTFFSEIKIFGQNSSLNIIFSY